MKKYFRSYFIFNRVFPEDFGRSAFVVYITKGYLYYDRQRRYIPLFKLRSCTTLQKNPEICQEILSFDFKTYDINLYISTG